MMELLESAESLALDAGCSKLPEYSTAPLFSEARGKMFGVLECVDRDDLTHWLYAFSGQYNSLWLLPGWAPPLFDTELFSRINNPEERRIKAITRQIETGMDVAREKELKRERTRRCRQLMKDIHALYSLTNFRGETATLSEVVGAERNHPTGMGDCCAPKLLNNAARQGLKPVSMAEFYFGRENRSRTRQHGQFYPPCSDKCGPLLGFLLCGV